MSIATIRSSFGFLGTMLRKWTGVSLKGEAIASIYNYRKITENLHSSGQPTARQFAAIRDAGFQRVINLAPHDAENALDDEAGLLAAMDMQYTHIPVHFKNPSDADFDAFVQAIKAAGEEPLWVHCAANMRVSAFIYRYRRDILKEEEASARADMEAIWEPFGVWKGFAAQRGTD